MSEQIYVIEVQETTTRVAYVRVQATSETEAEEAFEEATMMGYQDLLPSAAWAEDGYQFNTALVDAPIIRDAPDDYPFIDAAKWLK